MIRRFLGLAALSISLFIFLWGAWPFGKKTRSSPVMIQGVGTTPAVSNGAGREARQGNLEWPSIVRVGDTGTIRFELEAPGTGQGTDSGVDRADNWLIQVRLDLAEAGSAPPGEVSEPLRPGREAIFQWMVRPERTGSYQGVLWIYSRPISNQTVEGDLAQNRQVLSTQRIEFRAISLFSLGGPQARILGFTGAVLGLLITFESFLGNFWKEKTARTFER